VFTVPTGTEVSHLLPLEELDFGFIFEVFICDGARASSSAIASFTVSSSAADFFPPPQYSLHYVADT
jgi:hypothetical protein